MEDLSKIDFIEEKTIEIDYEDFIIYNIIGTKIWVAHWWDEEQFENEIVLENPDEQIYFDCDKVIFGVDITKEEFQKFKELKYDD